MKDYMQSLNLAYAYLDGRLTFHMSPQDQHCQEGGWRPSYITTERHTARISGQRSVRGMLRGRSKVTELSPHGVPPVLYVLSVTEHRDMCVAPLDRQGSLVCASGRLPLLELELELECLTIKPSELRQ